MPFPQFDRSAVVMKPLKARFNQKQVERDFVSLDVVPELSPKAAGLIAECAASIRRARQAGRPVVMAFGAHTIKNGLAPILIQMIERGWITHLATNGAGIIHDWEFAFQGRSSEDVRVNAPRGEFGNWQETGYFINLALNIGAYEGKGYGESLGSLIEHEQLTIPDPAALMQEVTDRLAADPSQAAAAAELLAVIKRFNLKPGLLSVPHPYKQFSIQAAAQRLNIPLTGHPMFGHDIIYNHPMNNGTLLGRAAQRDFLTFAHSISQIRDGVYLSVGSAVMSPMIFEKSLSMSQNVAIQNGTRIEGHTLFVVDLAESDWDWSRGEPPKDDAAYYQRYNKTFSRMGGTLRYLSADNRDFLLGLYHRMGTY